MIYINKSFRGTYYTKRDGVQTRMSQIASILIYHTVYTGFLPITILDSHDDV